VGGIMTRKDYERAAKLVNLYAQNQKDTSLLEEVFVVFFRQDNPRFNEELFRKACRNS